MKNPAKIDVWCGHLRVEQRATDTSGTLDVRRIIREGEGEQVQLSVDCTRHHAKRNVSQSFCFELSPADVDVLVRALTMLRPPYQERELFSERDAKDRAFYGLPPRP